MMSDFFYKFGLFDQSTSIGPNGHAEKRFRILLSISGAIFIRKRLPRVFTCRET
jgi:hypothetical protein